MNKSKFTWPTIAFKGQQLLLPFTSVEENYNRLGTLAVGDIVTAQPFVGQNTAGPWEYTFVYHYICPMCGGRVSDDGISTCNCQVNIY